MNSRRVRIGCEFVERATQPTPSVMQIRPHRTDAVAVVEEAWTVDPATPVHEYTDVYGNPCLRLVLPQGVSRFSYSGLVDVPDATEDVDVSAVQIPPADLPDDTLIFTLPSRYCLPELLPPHVVERFAVADSGHQRVQQVCDYVWGHLRFQYGTSTSTTTSHDVFHSGYGVCRDFTHLAIAICRALDIPARYAFGYLPEIDIEPNPEPMDFAAWMEVWLGDRWWTFDPRNNIRRKGRIVIGRGRDAGDVAMVTAFGEPVLESMTVIAEEV